MEIEEVHLHGMRLTFPWDGTRRSVTIYAGSARYWFAYLSARLAFPGALVPDGIVARLALRCFEPDGCPADGPDPVHLVRADGSCASCPEWHGWLLDLALEAGWQCPTLDAAVTARAALEGGE